MMQKKILAALAVAALSAGMSMNAFAAGADEVNKSVTVEFSGNIVDSACEIGIEKATVTLGDYSVLLFNKDGYETTPVDFNLEIGKCRLIEKADGDPNQAQEFPVDRVRLTFQDNGTQGFGRDGQRGGIMYLTDTERSAKNVGIRVTYESAAGEYVDVFTGGEQTDAIAVSNMNWTEIQSGIVTGPDGEIKQANYDNFKYNIPMRANIARVNNEAVTTGEVKGQMTVTLSYE